MEETVEDKLLDLYGISIAEAKYYWSDTLYINVLKQKITMAKKLQKKLLDAPLMTKDRNRINRIGKSITHNYMLLKEIE